MQNILKEPSRQNVINMKNGLQGNTAIYSNDYNLNPATTQSINMHKNTIKSTGPAILQLIHNPGNYASQPESTVNAVQHLYKSSKNPQNPKRKNEPNYKFATQKGTI